MKILNKKEFLERKDFFLKEMKKGKIFIYPTDTIYGIGCNAMNNDSVKKIREIKQRDEKPFSVIVPGKPWMEENCFINDKVKSWISKLPGPYTLILELKNLEAVSKEVNSGTDNLGVRIPDNWFSNIVEEMGFPFVTTSVNLTGEESTKSIDNLNNDIKDKVDYIIDSGVLEGNASTIVKLIGERVDIIERK